MDELRESRNIKEGYESYNRLEKMSDTERTSEEYVEYLMAMKRAHHLASIVPKKIISPRARYRQNRMSMITPNHKSKHSRDLQEAIQISTIASMVPDEIIYNHSDYAMRSYETALMFIDVSGFTDFCEQYTRTGSGGPSKLTQVLNSYIGAMTQEILTYSGDVLNFAGDSFLSMWKRTKGLTMQDVVHSAIDCGLIIQKNYGTHVTDIGVILKVKVAISAGVSHFAIIGSGNMATYVVVGEPVWDVKSAEHASTAGDVITTASVWMYVNEGDYCTQPARDGKHTKVLGVGLTWRRVEKLDHKRNSLRISVAEQDFERPSTSQEVPPTRGFTAKGYNFASVLRDAPDIDYREFTLRPALVAALSSTWWPELRRFMVTPVLRAVDNDEPMDFLTEVRHVVVVFVNIITKSVTDDTLIRIVDAAYKKVCSVTFESGGMVNKVSMFDKDMMFLVVFGLRGLKHEDEAQKALLCADELKKSLVEENIISISIGVTSGRTYCGVVGHVLRREYTVIGSAVNKAARLMVSYANKVTCDKETFVRSKLSLERFRLMKPRPLKGIEKPGPIYEFSKFGWAKHYVGLHHPILGRNEELRKFRDVLNNAILHQEEDYTKYRDLQYGVIIMGPRMVGKRRLMDEFLNITPDLLRSAKIQLTPNDMQPFMFCRHLLENAFVGTRYPHVSNLRDTFESRLRYSLGSTELSPLQIYALNTIFHVRFPLPEDFVYNGDLLSESAVAKLINNIFKKRENYLKVVAVIDGHYIDENSWRALIKILANKSVFLIVTLNDYNKLSQITQRCINNNIFVKMHLAGIARWYHAALACQLLDVQAIPADLEKVMESASGGLPGWIQNFVISLIQRGELTVVTVTRSEAINVGAVMPSAAMLQRVEDDNNRDNVSASVASFTSYTYSKADKQSSGPTEIEPIQMAVLAENYNFDNIKVDMAMDVIILKTYDSLSPFEKKVLKCASVLGDVFSRRMLIYLLQSDSQRKVAQAIGRLFEIRVLECEGGDFTRDTSMLLIHPAPALSPPAKPPFCFCLGTRPSPRCQDLPSYSFCGLMKFRHDMFKTTTYELLTENQKFELHSRALLFLERYTRRCASCGAGCFTVLFGERSYDGLIKETNKVKRVRQQISALSAETRLTADTYSDYLVETDMPNYTNLEAKAEERRLSQSAKTFQKTKHVRSFSSLELESCECYPILLCVYSQALEHCNAVGECEKLFDTYVEYTDLSLIGLNIPQAIRLLSEAETNYLKGEHGGISCNSVICSIPWVQNFRLARILALRGSCMLESGDYEEARKHLLRSMKLHDLPFPTSKLGVKFSDMQKSIQLFVTLCVCPGFLIGGETGWVGRFYDHISRSLNILFKLFLTTKEMENAALAAKWSWLLITKRNATFRYLCVSYANLITIYRLKRRFKMCHKLEKRVMEVCHQKRGQLDITEVHAVSMLYISIFSFYVECGKKTDSLEFGLTVIPMISSLPDITTGQKLILWMLKLLLSELRLQEMVIIMREFFYITDHYDLSSETWYYCWAIVMILDTGYCVDSYAVCEKFYMTKGDAILRSKAPEAAWNFLVSMWLMTIRVGNWERSILWEEKIKEIMNSPELYMEGNEFVFMVLIRLVEGLLITLVAEMDSKNIKKIISMEKNLKGLFQRIKKYCEFVTIIQSRYHLLYAYFCFVRGKRDTGFKTLEKAAKVANHYGHLSLFLCIQHQRNHWKGTLDPKLVNYWTEHVDVDSLLDYRDFDPAKDTIVPYTLPLPQDFEKVLF